VPVRRRIDRVMGSAVLVSRGRVPLRTVAVRVGTGVGGFSASALTNDGVRFAAFGPVRVRVPFF